MRTMKFRVWNGVEFCGVIGVGESVDKNLYEHWEDLFFQQFTGFTDKNGKEIYEGDIVRLGWNTTDVNWAGMLAEVVWWTNGFYFQTDFDTLAQDTFYQIKYCELVGNIFETPSKDE